MDELGSIMLCQMSPAQKDKHCLLSLRCRIWTASSSLSYDMKVEVKLLRRDRRREGEKRVIGQIKGHYLYV
jgi:hypothetical protein